MMKGGASLPTEPIPSSHQMINPAETADQVKEGGSPRWSSESVVRFAFGFVCIGGEGGPVGGIKQLLPASSQVRVETILATILGVEGDKIRNLCFS